MAFQEVPCEDLYYFNICTKHLVRTNPAIRHLYGGIPIDDVVSTISEAWRFPVIDSYLEPGTESASTRDDLVSFIYYDSRQAQPAAVSVIGSFHKLYEPLPLRQLANSPFFVLSGLIPRTESYYYRYRVDGESVVDPVNPQRVILDNGETWSRFFTRGCTRSLVLEHWERRLLDRLTQHILPFRTPQAENFLARHFQQLDNDARRTQYRHNQSIGVVNYIDKLLAKEESHHVNDYRICLQLIDALLRQRYPFDEPWLGPGTLFSTLYDQMAQGSVPGWNYLAYNNPRFFLQLLRRHTFTGAFSHPDYGGNAGAAAWAFLSERYRDETSGSSVFNWRRSLPPPLGSNPVYRG